MADNFDQYYLKKDTNTGTSVTDIINATGGGLALGTGELISPNYAKNREGWKISSDGSAEFQNIIVPKLSFGGTGTDGALSVSSGTTTIDCGGAMTLIKNYTLISITGTGSIVFTNGNANGTLVILRSQGAVTITSSNLPAIDLSGIGGSGGSSGSANSNNSGTSAAGGGGGSAANSGTAGGNGTGAPGHAGTVGSSSFTGVFEKSCTGGGQGTDGSTTGGSGGNPPSPVFSATDFNVDKVKYYVLPGAGGGGANGPGNFGSPGPDTSTSGGNGGGALFIECGGALNITSILWAKGSNSANAAGKGSSGGGGGGGSIGILYNTLTANTGTYTTTGGSGGTGGSATGGTGGTGFSFVAKNNYF